MCEFVARAWHETFPFFRYLGVRRRIRKELASFASGRVASEGPTLDAVRRYIAAESEDIKEELAAQQSRAVALDEKTFKYATSIATALTIASAATTAVAQLLTNPDWKLAIVLVGLPAIGYVMAGGLLGIAAARTMEGYGTGIQFRLEQEAEQAPMRPHVLAEALACQERINVVRVARNEAAFMCIRNGFIFVTLTACMVLAGAQFQDRSDKFERKVWQANAGASIMQRLPGRRRIDVNPNGTSFGRSHFGRVLQD